MELAAQHAREAGDRAQEIEALAGTVIPLVYGPEPAATALARIEQIEHQSDGARRLQASALRGQASLQAMLGNFDSARDLITRADQIAVELGLENMRAAGILRVAGEIELMAGDPSAAEHYLRQAFQSLERDKDWGHLASVAPLLAEALLAQGREDEAERLLELTAEWVIEDDTDAQVLLHCASSKLAALRGDPTAAEALARRAVERGEKSDEINAHAGALLRLAEALELANRESEAAAAAREALDLYRRKGNASGAERVRERLAD
jgi:ATP/maltotriose-dependent transcriptional regulator MalT